MSKETLWIIIGLVGQGLFTMRFVVQWISSEKNKKSVIPLAFWYFSLAGGIVLFSYAVYRKDPVFILGQSFGVFVYTRNLYFIYREKKTVE